ncbi:MAG: apolipoprotein N-acyltransferase [Thermodesulfobacteriota bacterium]
MHKSLHLSDLLGAVLSGLLLAAAFPQWHQTYLLAVFLIPLLCVLRKKTLLAALRLGMVAGLAYFLVLLYWIYYVCHVFGGLPQALAVGVLVLLALYLSIFRGLWAMGVSWGAARGLKALWWVPTLWVVLEFVQTYFLFNGFPWELLGNGLYRWPVLLQVADLTGVYGLSFLIVLINTCLFLFFFSSREQGARRFLYLPLIFLILAGWVGYGIYRLDALEQQEAESPKIKVAVVQGNIKQGEKWQKEMVQATLERYAQLTGQVPGSHLVVWPETAAPFFFLRSPQLTAQVQEIAQKSDSYLLFGSPAWELTPAGERYYNRAYLLNPQGEVVGFYDKAHLVPYGEYVPAARFFPFISKMVPMIGDFAEGPVGGVVPLPEGSLGPLICFESIFPYLSRAQVQNGAHLLVNITNDAWFGKTSAPYQHLSMAVLRAVENHVPLARAANTGISAFIGRDGSILWQSGLFVTAAQALELPWLPGGSIYSRVGDVFAWTCVILVGLGLMFGGVRRVR